MGGSYSDEEIERFVRFPDTLPEEQRKAIGEALEKEEGLTRVAAFYRAFWEEYDALRIELSPRARDLLDRLMLGL